jgi:hypothetical protein
MLSAGFSVDNSLCTILPASSDCCSYSDICTFSPSIEEKKLFDKVEIKLDDDGVQGYCTYNYNNDDEYDENSDHKGHGGKVDNKTAIDTDNSDDDDVPDDEEDDIDYDNTSDESKYDDDDDDHGKVYKT